jgi:hypothetical protein
MFVLLPLNLKKCIQQCSAYAYRCYYCVLSICKKMYVKIKRMCMLEIWGKRKAGIKMTCSNLLFCRARHLFSINFSSCQCNILNSVFVQNFTYQYEDRFLITNNDREMVFLNVFRQGCAAHLQCGVRVYTLLGRRFTRSLCVVHILLYLPFQPLVDKPLTILFEVPACTTSFEINWPLDQISLLFCFVVARMYLHGNL